MKKKITWLFMFVFLPALIFSQGGLNSNIIELNSISFKNMVWDYNNDKSFKFKGDLPVIIDFYASWCPPCKKLYPHLMAIQNKYSDSLRIYRVDVDNAPEVAKLFNVNNLPTILFVSKDNSYNIEYGYKEQSEYEKLAIKYLLNNKKVLKTNNLGSSKDINNSSYSTTSNSAVAGAIIAGAVIYEVGKMIFGGSSSASSNSSLSSSNEGSSSTTNVVVTALDPVEGDVSYKELCGYKVTMQFYKYYVDGKKESVQLYYWPGDDNVNCTGTDKAWSPGNRAGYYMPQTGTDCFLGTSLENVRKHITKDRYLIKCE